MDHHHTTSIGTRIREARIRRGLTQAELADRVHVAPSHLANIEAGRRSVDGRDLLGRIAAALTVLPVELTGEPYPLPNDPEGNAASDAMPALWTAILDRPTGPALPVPKLRDDVEILTRLHRLGRIGDALTMAPIVISGLRVAAAVGGADDSEVARLTVLAGWTSMCLLQNTGRAETAMLTWPLTDAAADRAGDPVSRGLAAATHAYALVHVPVGAYGQALDEATAAFDALTPVGGAEAAAARGQLQLVSAFAASALGDTDGTAERLHVAGEHAELVGDEPTLFGAYLGFGEVNRRFHRVSAWMELGEPDRALADSVGLTVEMSPYPGRAACWKSDMARAYAALGQPGEAMRELRVAEQLNAMRTRQHPLVRDAVGQMVRAAQRAAVPTELDELARRMGLRQ